LEHAPGPRPIDDPDGERLEPVDPVAPLPPGFDRAEAWQLALVRRPELAGARLEVENHQAQVRYHRNQLFPRLDLEGSYGGRTVREGFGATVGDMAEFSGPAYTVGVVFSMPLGRQGARNGYRSSQTASAQAEAAYKRLEERILVEVERAGRVAQSSYQRLDAVRQARVFAGLALELDQQKLAAGATTFFTVLRLQRNLTEARANEIRAQADYQQALARLALAEGSTLERHHLEVECK